MIQGINQLAEPVAPPRGAELEITAPRTMNVSWSEAHDAARRLVEPVFVPITVHSDDRGWSMMNLMAGALSASGQINFSMQYPGAIKAWHRHQLQTDFWTCAAGNLKAGVYREADARAWVVVMGEQRPGVLVIPPTLWHGAAVVGPRSVGLLYYVTHAYDPAQPDEERRAHDSVPGFPWGTRHG